MTGQWTRVEPMDQVSKFDSILNFIQPHSPELSKVLLLCRPISANGYEYEGHILLTWHGEQKPEVVACPDIT